MSDMVEGLVLVDCKIVNDDLIPRPRCATCRWAEWKLSAISLPVIDNPITPDVFAPAYTGTCTRMATAAHHDGGAPIHADTLAYAVDMESWLGCPGLAVSPDFGCVMHEAKP